MLHVSMYHVAAQGYVIICLFKCWVCWSNKSFALSPGRLPSVEGNGTWNVYTVSSSSMLGRRQTNRGWTGDDRVAAPSQRPSKLSIQKWHDAALFDIVSLSHQADAICEILRHLSVCTRYNKMPHEDDIDAYGSEHNLDTLDAARIIPREVRQNLLRFLV